MSDDPFNKIPEDPVWTEKALGLIESMAKDLDAAVFVVAMQPPPGGKTMIAVAGEDIHPELHAMLSDPEWLMNFSARMIQRDKVRKARKS